MLLDKQQFFVRHFYPLKLSTGSYETNMYGLFVNVLLLIQCYSKVNGGVTTTYEMSMIHNNIIYRLPICSIMATLCDLQALKRFLTSSPDAIVAALNPNHYVDLDVTEQCLNVHVSHAKKVVAAGPDGLRKAVFAEDKRLWLERHGQLSSGEVSPIKRKSSTESGSTSKPIEPAEPESPVLAPTKKTKKTKKPNKKANVNIPLDSSDATDQSRDVRLSLDLRTEHKSIIDCHNTIPTTDIIIVCTTLLRRRDGNPRPFSWVVGSFNPTLASALIDQLTKQYQQDQYQQLNVADVLQKMATDQLEANNDKPSHSYMPAPDDLFFPNEPVPNDHIEANNDKPAHSYMPAPDDLI